MKNKDMEDHLSRNKFFLGTNVTIADISLYAYTHVAEEGGFELSKYINIKRCLQDFESIAGYVEMNRENE